MLESLDSLPEIDSVSFVSKGFVIHHGVRKECLCENWSGYSLQQKKKIQEINLWLWPVIWRIEDLKGRKEEIVSTTKLKMEVKGREKEKER